MPTVTFGDTRFECERGVILRNALLEHGSSPHNGASRTLNCRGRATCGTCAVEVDGGVSDPTRQEMRRLSFPPHDPARGLRLACQTRILGDVTVTKHGGFWGQDAPTREMPETEGIHESTH